MTVFRNPALQPQSADHWCNAFQAPNKKLKLIFFFLLAMQFKKKKKKVNLSFKVFCALLHSD